MAQLDPLELLKKVARIASERKMFAYRPYGHPEMESPDGEQWKYLRSKYGWEEWSNKPWQTDFHALGASCKERMLMAANGAGKSISGAYETAIHLTGEYPDWWEGYRFEKAPKFWIGSITNEIQRDYIQPLLLGDDLNSNLGTGFIPKANIMGRPTTRQCGISGVADTFRVRHKSGGIAKAQFKVYEQGWRKWQASAPDGIWLDEEPDENVVDQKDIFAECQTRVVRTSGIIYVTYTPLLGMTQLTEHFMNPKSEGIGMVTATWDDAPHLKKEDKDRLIASYPQHQVEARTKGIPMLGEGAIFTHPESDLVVDPFEIPSYFAQIKGIDFGVDHPAGYGKIAWDRDKDIIYVVDSWAKSGCDVSDHAERINKDDIWAPVAWPHDGGNREKSTGKQLKTYYVEAGVKMLGKSARYPKKEGKEETGGSQRQWPIIEEIKLREQNGSLKVFKTATKYLEERRNYHTKDGKIVSKRDDALKAVFYAIMMRRYARAHHMPVLSKPPALGMTTRI